MLQQFHSALGLVGLMLLAWAISENRRSVPLRPVLAGVALQILIGWLLLKVPVSQQFFSLVNDGVLALQQSTQAGSIFVFGYLAGEPLPFEEIQPGSSFIFHQKV